MNFFKNLLKKKTNITDILLSMEKFNGDIQSLSSFKNLANSFFGTNWKFNLELYISSLSQNEKEKYLTLFKKITEYEHAIAIWNTVNKLIKKELPVSSETIANLTEYETYLSKFGTSGNNLYKKLKETIDIHSTNETETKILSKNDEITENKNKKVKELAPTPTPTPTPTPAPTPAQTDATEIKLKQTILQKVQDLETKQNKKYKKETPQKKQPSTQKKEVLTTTISTNDTKNWLIENFIKVQSFLSNSREIMSAISLYKNAPNLEEYPYYGFIIDTIDYLISQGNKILNEKNDDEINNYFKGGKTELTEIIQFYKEQKNNEIIIPKNK